MPMATGMTAFFDNKKSGHGVYTYADGRRYEGEWRDDKPTGKLP